MLPNVEIVGLLHVNGSLEAHRCAPLSGVFGPQISSGKLSPFAAPSQLVDLYDPCGRPYGLAFLLLDTKKYTLASSIPRSIPINPSRPATIKAASPGWLK